MTRKTLFVAIAAVAAGATALYYYSGSHPAPRVGEASAPTAAAGKTQGTVTPTAPAITVFRTRTLDFQQSIQVTGTLVPREEILISPEIEGQRLVDVLADEGMRVTKGQVLARLETATLDAQLAQSDANLSRTSAAIAQAQSQIVQAEARVEEARNAVNRATPLRQSGYLAESTFEAREATAKTADATLVAARDGLKVAEAEKALIEAQRRELVWKRSRSEIRSPVDGIVSRRIARIGGLASAVGDPLFRIIDGGEVELDAEVPESQLARLKQDQPATINVAGLGDIKGRVRLVSPEIDKTTRLGRVRILLDPMDRPRVGSFARGNIIVATGRGLAVPASAVLYQNGEPRVQVVIEDRVTTRTVTTGITSGDLVEVTRGITEGEFVIAKAGTFLRDGDKVRAVADTTTRLSEAK